MVSKSNTVDPTKRAVIRDLLSNLTAEQFRDWYRERQYRKNIENGTPYFNEPGTTPEPERHSPSQLLQCHRKIVYRQHNAPAEQPDPEGIFWFGTQFEENIAFPFLERAVTGPDTYVRNTEWIDFTVQTDAGDLRIKGATDPVIVDSDAIPVLPTEIKTKASLETVSSPSRHHKAQLHAYMMGLSEKFDINLTNGALLYGSRESLNVKVFHVSLDKSFWQDVVLEWAENHTQYRLNEELPPDTPEYGWECKFCDFRERCGKGSIETDGFGPAGLLPLFNEYPRETLVEYLDSHARAKLTPTLAHHFPNLGSEYGKYDWECSVCGTTVSVTSTEWNGDTDRPPLCNQCGEDGMCSELAGPSPEKQVLLMGEQDD